MMILIQSRLLCALRYLVVIKQSDKKREISDNATQRLLTQYPTSSFCLLDKVSVRKEMTVPHPRRRGLEPNMLCVKNLLLGMNCLFVMTGLLLIAVGSTIKGFYASFDELLGSDIVSPATFLIAVGAIVFFVALFGCLGALRESTCLINMFTICLLVVFVLELAAGLAGFVMQSSVRGTLSANFKYAIKNEYLKDDEVYNAIENIQSQLECCGADTPEDWADVLSANDSQLQEGDIIVPNSCCGLWNVTNEGSVECGEPYTEGCLDRLAAEAQAGAMLLTGAAITVALIQAMGVYFSNELAKAIRQAKSLRAMRQMEIRNTLANSYSPMSKERPTTPAPIVYLAGNSDDTPA